MHLRLALLAVALVLPTVSLVLLGSLWLWQHGYVLYWAMGTCIAVTGAYLLERRLMLPLPPAAVASLQEGEPGEKAWTPRQEEAWARRPGVRRQGPRRPHDQPRRRLNLGLETVELVAKRLHPERDDPLLQFTVPEALALIERTSDGLRNFILATFPLGDRDTVAQLMWLYRSRSAVNLAEKGYLSSGASCACSARWRRQPRSSERCTRQSTRWGRAPRRPRRPRLRPRGGPRGHRSLRRQPARHQGAADEPRLGGLPQDMAALEKPCGEPIRILEAGQTGRQVNFDQHVAAPGAVVETVPATKSSTTYKLTHEAAAGARSSTAPGLRQPEGHRAAGRCGAPTARWCVGL